MDLVATLGIRHPVIQAPMAGVATPAMAAAVSEAGGLGSLGLGASPVEGAREAIRATRALTGKPFNVNFFCHQPAQRDAGLEAAWLERLAPEFARFGGSPPSQLREIYTPFAVNDAMLAMVLEERPAVVSFHFGLPSGPALAALREAGIFLIASATSLREAQILGEAGIDAVIAQGYEAGGHRGIFDPHGEDARLSTHALTRLLVSQLDLPVIAAGGIMDGAGILAVLDLGAQAAQLGTAFINCPESSADAGYRAVLSRAQTTVMTPAVSGRPARVVANRLSAIGVAAGEDRVPAYPCTYDASKALHQLASAAGEQGYGAHWAGQGAGQGGASGGGTIRSLPAGELVEALVQEMAGVPNGNAGSDNTVTGG